MGLIKAFLCTRLSFHVMSVRNVFGADLRRVVYRVVFCDGIIDIYTNSAIE